VRGIPFGVAVVTAGLYFLGLAQAPFLDPPEGFHADIAQSMLESGDWITPHVNTVRYFDEPPVPYWLMAAAFAMDGVTAAAARFWTALAGVAVAAVTARVGMMLGSPRLALLAGLMVAANLGMFLHARIVKPDLLFILCIVLAYAGFAVAYRGGGPWALALFYGCLGLAAMTKDLLGAVGPLVVVALFFWLTRERPVAPFVPWWGIGLLVLVVVPWYVAVEARNPGFLWYTAVDTHALSFTRQRVLPGEDVPLGPFVFLGVTVLAFLPWALALPWAIVRAFRRPWEDATARLWVLFALWPLVVIGFFTLSPFKLPHHGLPAFPALALLAARVWDESIDALPDAVPPRILLAPILVTFAVVAAAFTLAWLDRLPLPPAAMNNVDVATRNLAARGEAVPRGALEPYLRVLASSAVIFGGAAVAMAVAVWRQAPGLGVAVALAAMVAFLPFAGDGMAQFARSRSARLVVEALVLRLQPGDEVIHEGALENTGSLLLAVRRPVRVVNGLQSSLAFGATFAESRALFWDEDRLRAAWPTPGRRFLVSGVDPARSVVRALPPGSVHLVARSGGRSLYANLAE
jgi:4-amino-4-deoxy-L-arabinose transferase-like glycosyltransferase